jgi:hypothetical protein
VVDILEEKVHGQIAQRGVRNVGTALARTRRMDA